MEQEQYKQISSFEQNNWWYRARLDLLDKIISSQNRKFDSILDAGCGVGNNAQILLKHSQNVYGLDKSGQALDFCSGRGYVELVNSSISEINLDRQFDLIVCMDVLEHMEDDRRAVNVLKQHLSESGVLVISVPAHTHLWNDNDIFSHHLRRYKLIQLKQIAGACGLEILKISYWNQFMYLPYLVFSLLGKFRAKRNLQNNLNLIPGCLNSVLFKVLKFENSLFMKGCVWCGASVVCLCKKKQ